MMLVLIACVGVAYGAPTAKGIVVPAFSGPLGADAAHRLTNVLGSFRVIDVARYQRAVKRTGAAQAARSLGVAVLLRGSIRRIHGRWSLRITVEATQDERRLGQRVFPLRGPRLDPVTARRVARSIAPLIRRAHVFATTTGSRERSVTPSPGSPGGTGKPAAPSSASRPAANVSAPEGTRGFDDGGDLDQGGVVLDDSLTDDTQPTGAASDTRKSQGDQQNPLGFSVSGSGASTKARNGSVVGASPRGQRGAPPAWRHGTKKTTTPSGRRPNWEAIFDASVGVVLLNRSFQFNNAATETPTLSTPGVLPAIWVEGSVYPAAAFSRSPLANIGFHGRFYRAFGGKAEVGATSVPTVLQMYELGIEYRWNIFEKTTSPLLRGRVDFGQQMFDFSSKGDNPDPLPDINYVYLKPGLVFEWPFLYEDKLRVGVLANFDYLVVFSAGDIENSNSTGYGSATVIAMDGGVGLFGGYAGFFARLGAFYRGFFFNFDRTCSSQGCKIAAGANDSYIGGLFTLGYTY